MKAIIFYATKHGATAEIAQRIAEEINGAVIHNLKKDDIPSLADFDCVIIGSSVYAGNIHKEAKEFLLNRKNILLDKKLGLFVSGIGAEGEKKYFETNFPQEILKKAKIASFLGGIFNPAEASGFECFIMKLAAKQSEYINTIDDEKIIKFAETMKA